MTNVEEHPKMILGFDNKNRIKCLSDNRRKKEYKRRRAIKEIDFGGGAMVVVWWRYDSVSFCCSKMGKIKENLRGETN